MQPDSYDIALLKACGILFNGDENLRIRAVDKVRVLDEENINEANFERDGDIKRIKYNLALWKTDNSNGKRQVICWIENHFKKIDNYIEN